MSRGRFQRAFEAAPLLKMRAIRPHRHYLPSDSDDGGCIWHFGIENIMEASLPSALLEEIGNTTCVADDLRGPMESGAIIFVWSDAMWEPTAARPAGLGRPATYDRPSSA